MRPSAPAEGRSGFGIVLILVGAGLLVVAIGLGFFAAYTLTGRAEAAPPAAVEAASESGPENAYVPFGTTVVNLSGARLTRYLQVNITMEVDKETAPAVREQVENQKAVFKNWLITYLSDKKLDEVEGAASIRKLQREIEDGFEQVLKEVGGGQQLKAVYFEEFNVQ